MADIPLYAYFYTIFSLDQIETMATLQDYRTMYGLRLLLPKKFRKLPSAARFCAKRFRHIDFWTFFLSIFSKFFRVLCKVNRNITKLNHVINA
jgi:hypothetical protein